MSTCIDCYGTTSIDPCGTTGCISTNYGKCITYSGADLFCATGAVKTFSVTGVAVNPTVLTEYTVSPTGGAGSSLSVKVTRTPGSTTYTVTLVSAGSGYAINDVVTVAGASLGGTTPANNLSLVITALVPLISSVNTIDEVIANINARLCTLTSVGLNYSGFNYGCLRVGGNLDSVGTAITSAQGFTESTAAALCSLNTRTLALETPAFTAACVPGITSGTSTLSQVLTAYATKICSINTQIDLTGVTALCFTTAPSTSADLQVWFDWVVSNVCSIKTTTDANVTAVTTNANNLKTYISGGSAVPASINTSCITGGSTTSTLSAAAILFTSQICAINTTLASVPAGSYSLSWATNFGSTAYYGYTFGLTNTSASLQTQLDRVVSTLGRMKLKLNVSDFVATSDSDGLNISLASGVRFACSQLSTCSISALSDVTTSSPATYHTLFWNGSEFVNKELIFTSAGSTVNITRTNNPTNVTVNLEVTASTVTSGTLSPNPPANITVTPSIKFPIGGFVKVYKHGSMATLSGSIGATFSGAFSWSNNQAVQLMDLPVGYINPNPEYFQITIITYTSAAPTVPAGVYRGVGLLAGGGSLQAILINPAGTVNFALGDTMEIIVGGFTYKI
jgi:hypothetical protein